MFPCQILEHNKPNRMNTQHRTIAIALTAGLFISCQETTHVAEGTTKSRKALPELKTPANPVAPSARKNSAIKPYKRVVCIVSDEELGSMGEPITEVYHGQEIKFCCKSCVKKFHASPQQYIDKLNNKTTP
jgi:hypothetical protein